MIWLTEQEYINKLSNGSISLNDVPEELQTEAICIAAVKKNSWNLLYVKNQTEEICLSAVKQNSSVIQYVKNKTDEICRIAIANSPYNLEYIENQTEEICLSAVNIAGLAIKHVREQTEEICLAAVKQNTYALRNVKNQTEEICISAVKQNGFMLEYVKNQTEEICSLAIKENPFSFIHVDANIYKYNKDEIILCFKKIKELRAENKIISDEYSIKFFKKLSEILGKIDNGVLLDVVDNDLNSIFKSKRQALVNSVEDLKPIREKVAMLRSIKNKKFNYKIKPKIL